MRLELRGHVPSKASDYRRGRNGGLYLPPGTAMELAGLQFQLNALWGGKPTLIDPDITLEFHVSNPLQDKDGCIKATLDIMQKAGVIKNDNIKFCNGWLHIAPAVITSDEKVVIDIR